MSRSIQRKPHIDVAMPFRRHPHLEMQAAYFLASQYATRQGEGLWCKQCDNDPFSIPQSNCLQELILQGGNLYPFAHSFRAGRKSPPPSPVRCHNHPGTGGRPATRTRLQQARDIILQGGWVNPPLLAPYCQTPNVSPCYGGWGRLHLQASWTLERPWASKTPAGWFRTNRNQAWPPQMQCP